MFCFWPPGSHSILLAEGKVGCAVWVPARRLRLVGAAILLCRSIDPRREGRARQSAQGLETHTKPQARKNISKTAAFVFSHIYDFKFHFVLDVR